MFSCEYYEIFKDTYFEKHLRKVASVYDSSVIVKIDKTKLYLVI